MRILKALIIVRGFLLWYPRDEAVVSKRWRKGDSVLIDGLGHRIIFLLCIPLP